LAVVHANGRAAVKIVTWMPVVMEAHDN